MIIFRGVNLYPAHVDEILSQIPGIGSEYQIHLNHLEDGKDYMALKVERADAADPQGDPALSRSIAAAIRKKLLVSGEVEMVAYGALPRSERKSKRVYDNRGF
jgi:phenylacetate-CoA ligase